MGEQGRTRESYFYGESAELSISSDLVLWWLYRRTLVITANSAGLYLKLPPATGLQTGAPHFYIIVEGSNSVGIKDWGGTVLTTFSPNDFATVCLLSNSTNAGKWRFSVGVQNTVVNPPAPILGYIIGGLPAPRTTVWEYNQQLEAWTSKSDSPRDRENPGSFVISTKGYVFGGDVGVTSCDEYDPPTFIAKTAMGIYQHSGGGATVSDLGYRVGGSDGASHDTTEEFDPTGSGTWTGKTDVPSSNIQGSVEAVSGKVYAFRGATTNATWEFDPVGNSWDTLVSRPGVNFRYFPAARIDDMIYVFMGSPDASTRKTDVDRYDPATGAWVAMLDWPYSSGKFEHSAWSVDDVIYICNDNTGTNQEMATFEAIGPKGLWTQLDDIPYSARRNVYNAAQGITA